MKHIITPAIIESIGNKPKIIEEFIGKVNSQNEHLSIAKMTAPEGWEEPGQTPEFDEYTIVQKGCLRVKTILGITEVKAGESLEIMAGEWVQYSSPHEGGVEYLAICTPAFDSEIVNRDPKVDMANMSDEDAQELASQLRKPTGEKGLRLASWLNEGNAFITEQAYTQLSTTKGGTCLEIGFGNGYYLHQLLAFNTHVTGVDFSQDMVDIATNIQKQRIEEGKITLKCEDASHLSFKDNTFDQIVGVNTLYFWDNAVTVLNEIYRVLKPGGSLVLGIRPKGAAAPLKFTDYGFTLYTEKEAIDTLKKAGYKEVTFKTTPDGFLESMILTAKKQN